MFYDSEGKAAPSEMGGKFIPDPQDLYEGVKSMGGSERLALSLSRQRDSYVKRLDLGGGSFLYVFEWDRFNKFAWNEIQREKENALGGSGSAEGGSSAVASPGSGSRALPNPPRALPPRSTPAGGLPAPTPGAGGPGVQGVQGGKLLTVVFKTGNVSVTAAVAEEQESDLLRLLSVAKGVA